MAHTLRVGWQVLLDENEWDSDAEVTIPAPEVSAHPTARKRSWGGWYTAGILLLLTLAVGVRLWQQAQSGLAAVERGVSHTLALETEASSVGDELLASALLDPQADVKWRELMLAEKDVVGERAAADIEITDFALQGDRAMAQVRVTDRSSGAVYRESRFYRETNQGWLRSQPAAELWGEPRTLESEYFIFTYVRLDGPAVFEAAPLLDRAFVHMYTTLGQALPVGIRPEEKVAVHLVMQGGSNTPWYRKGNPLAVNSPRLIRLPERVTDGQAVAEFVAVALRRAAVNRTIALQQVYQPAPEFLSGLRLWLAWGEDLVQANYRRETVLWLYANGSDDPLTAQTRNRQRCELVYAWGNIMPVVPVTFYCSSDQFPSSFDLRPSTNLRQVPLGLRREFLDSEASLEQVTSGLYVTRIGQSIAIATLLEYATQTFGQTSVLALLQAAQEGKSWHTAAPELFGVSEADFEAGWWTWLTAEYGVDTSAFQADNHFDIQHLAFPSMPDAVIDSATPSDVRAAGR